MCFRALFSGKRYSTIEPNWINLLQMPWCQFCANLFYKLSFQNHTFCTNSNKSKAIVNVKSNRPSNRCWIASIRLNFTSCFTVFRIVSVCSLDHATTPWIVVLSREIKRLSCIYVLLCAINMIYLKRVNKKTPCWKVSRLSFSVNSVSMLLSGSPTLLRTHWGASSPSSEWPIVWNHSSATSARSGGPEQRTATAATAFTVELGVPFINTRKYVQGQTCTHRLR